jgi:hypothetical protein
MIQRLYQIIQKINQNPYVYTCICLSEHQGIPGGEPERRSRGQRDEIEVASGYYFFPGWVNGDGDSVKTVKW